MFEYDETQFTTKIKIIGVGGGGGNAVNSMIDRSLKGVEFIVANTDISDLKKSKAKVKLQLGRHLCEGHGTGAYPDKGEEAARESEEEIKTLLKDTDLLFLTAGMGGGTGTGASPVIASIAKKLDILTIGVVSLPFENEGKMRKNNASDGIKKLKKEVDTLIVFQNEKLRENFSNMLFMEAFKKTDEILYNSVKAISDIINITGYINLDYADIKAITADKGYALIGVGEASGADRAVAAAQAAINNPLLDSMSLNSCDSLLINIAAGTDLRLNEVDDINDVITHQTGKEKNIYQGLIIDEEMVDKISVTIIATGLKTNLEEELIPQGNEKRVEITSSKEFEEITKRISLQEQLKQTQIKTPVMEEKRNSLEQKETPLFLKQYTN